MLMDRSDALTKRSNKTVVAQLGIFQRRQSIVIDIDCGGYDAGDAGLGKLLFEMAPCRRHTPVVVRCAPSHRRTQDPIFKLHSLDTKWVKEHALLPRSCHSVGRRLLPEMIAHGQHISITEGLDAGSEREV